jgi:hypothetical protein
MEIYTAISADGDLSFERLKRKKWTGWEYLVSGEWAESPMNLGSCHLHITSTADKQYWAIMDQGWPRRILAVAKVITKKSVNEIAAEMLIRVKKENGYHITRGHGYGSYVDLKLFWKILEKQGIRA